MALQHIVSGALLLTAGGALADACCCTPTPPPDECTWYLSPDTLAFDCLAQSGSFNINVPTGTNCGWEASVTSGGAFTTITAGASGNTDGTVDFDLIANPDPDRTAQITVLTTVVSPLGPIGTVIGAFTIDQAECAAGGGGIVPGGGGGSPPAPGTTCSWSVGPTNFLMSCFPQGAFFNVNTQLGCGWEAVIISGGSFITITSGTPGGDAGSVFFTVSTNGGVARGGQIEVRTTVVSSYGPIGTVVAIVNIAQNVCPGGGGGAACSWGVSPSTLIAADPCNGQSLQTTVFTYIGCGWEAIPQVPWLTITSGSTGLSTGNIVFDVDANTTGAERSGQIFVHATTASVLGPAGTKIGTITVKEDTCAPFACPGGLNASYSIDGYVDGLITASSCGACLNDVTDPIWDGVWNEVSPCFYQITGGTMPLDTVRIDGKEVDGVSCFLMLTLDPRWEIYIQCSTGVIAWQGIKTTGATPEGVYTKIFGCATGPTTLTIV